MASNKGLGKGLGALLGDFVDEPMEQSAYRAIAQEILTKG